MMMKILRAVWMLIFIGIGGLSGQYLPLDRLEPVQFLSGPLMSVIIGMLLGLLVGIFLAPWLANWVVRTTTWLEQRLQKIPLSEIFGGALGLIIGLLIGILLGSAFSWFQPLATVMKIIGATLLGYLGMNIGAKKKDELFTMIISLGRKKKESQSQVVSEGAIPKILDTSVIIDGRIADIIETGFLEGPVVVPGFVLEELRHIADSSDVLKRNRGRRGLDILNKIRKDLKVKVEVVEKDFDDIAEVDSKLVRLAQQLNGKIITNDFNLNKVAELQGVLVLNINELANAVKPMVLPGEEMNVQIVKDGKETGQGVGYLEDGTMIVVDGGKRHIGQNVIVVVTSVLQTAAGRMIFARPKLEIKEDDANRTKLNEVNAIG
ncbi:MAG: PIN/TRAM domain-containing protein [Bacillota bacterium]